MSLYCKFYKFTGLWLGSVTLWTSAVSKNVDETSRVESEWNKTVKLYIIYVYIYIYKLKLSQCIIYPVETQLIHKIY
jgi:hypothetical protein